jgi:hypothetical protein
MKKNHQFFTSSKSVQISAISGQNHERNLAIKSTLRSATTSRSVKPAAWKSAAKQAPLSMI